MKKIKNKNWFIFIPITSLVIIILIFLSIVTFSKDKGLNILGYSYTFAVNRDQELNVEEGSLRVSLVKYSKIKQEQIKEEVEVLVYDQNREKDYLWVEKVIKIENDLVTLKYNDYLQSQILNKEVIQLKYIKTANNLGYLYYVITEKQNFIFIFFPSLVIILGFYTLLIYKKNKNEKENQNEEDCESKETN